MRDTPRRDVCFLAGYCTRKGHVAGNHDVQIWIMRTRLYMTHMTFVLRLGIAHPWYHMLQTSLRSHCLVQLLARVDPQLLIYMADVGLCRAVGHK